MKKLNSSMLEEVSETLRVMAHPLRLSIIKLLAEKKELSVTEIHQKLEIEQAIASHHLRILKNRKVVQVRRDGQRSIYNLVHKNYFKVITLVADLK